MNENILFEEQKPIDAPKRPQFLTVLCILTFIGSALGLLGAIYGYFSAKSSAAMMDTMGNTPGMEGMGGMMMGEVQATMRKAAENAFPNMIIGIVCSLLCLFGALQMWQLKKQGFYIYTVGEIAAPIAAFILGAGGMIGGIGAIFGVVIAIVWIVLYALNLKHLK